MSAARSRAAALIVGTGIPVAWLEAGENLHIACRLGYTCPRDGPVDR